MAANVDGNGDEAPVVGQGVGQGKSMGVLVLHWIRVLSLCQYLHVIVNGCTFYVALQIRRKVGVAIGGLYEPGVEVMSQILHLANEANVPVIALWQGGCFRFIGVQSFVHTRISFTDGVLFIIGYRVHLLSAVVHVVFGKIPIQRGNPFGQVKGGLPKSRSLAESKHCVVHRGWNGQFVGLHYRSEGD